MAVPGGWASVIERSSFPLARSHMVICKQTVFSTHSLSRVPSITSYITVQWQIPVLTFSPWVSRGFISKKSDLSYQRNPFLSCSSKQFTCLFRVDTMCYLNSESCPFGQLSPPAPSPSAHSYLPNKNIKECKITLLPPNKSNAFLSHRTSERWKSLITALSKTQASPWLPWTLSLLSSWACSAWQGR